MQLNDINQFFQLAIILKVGLLLVMFLFVIFLLVVVRQVRSMNSIITQTFFGRILNAIAVLLLLFGISLFAVAVVIL